MRCVYVTLRRERQEREFDFTYICQGFIRKRAALVRASLFSKFSKSFATHDFCQAREKEYCLEGFLFVARNVEKYPFLVHPEELQLAEACKVWRDGRLGSKTVTWLGGVCGGKSF